MDVELELGSPESWFWPQIWSPTKNEDSTPLSWSQGSLESGLWPQKNEDSTPLTITDLEVFSLAGRVVDMFAMQIFVSCTE